MILIGQFDSSFTRRIGIALTLYGLPFEHRPWSVFGDAEKIRPLNPLVRVPTLVLDDGEVLVETFAILDHLDSLAPEDRRLCPSAGPLRRKVLNISALAGGAADHCVSLFYLRAMHKQVSAGLQARRLSQINGTLDALEAARAKAGPQWIFGESLTHADIAVTASLRHITDSLPQFITLEKRPALAAHCAVCEAMDVFQDISQAFIAPA